MRIHLTCYCGNDLGVQSIDKPLTVVCPDCGVELVLDEDRKGWHGETFDEVLFEKLAKLVEDGESRLSSVYVDL